MNLTQILLICLTTILTGLFGWLTTLVTSWLTTKIKDEKLKKLVLSLNEIIIDSCKYTYQTYVESLKDKNIFDKKCQEEALGRAVILCKNKLTEDMRNYILKSYPDIEDYLREKIEEAIYSLKK